MKFVSLIGITIAAVCAQTQATDDGFSPIFEFIRNEDIDGLKKAVQDGEDINAIGHGGQSTVMHASLGGWSKSLQTLLELGADPMIPEENGYTPMHGVGFQGRTEAAKVLLEHGLDPMNKHKDGYYPIHRACWGKTQAHADTIKVFLEAGVPADVVSGQGETPLDIATFPAVRNVLQEYLDKGKPTSDIPERDEDL